MSETTATATATASGFCPNCAGSFRLIANGMIARHGFSAKNVRRNHGIGYGYHIGGCSVEHRIGTAFGNELAAANVSRYRARAIELRAYEVTEEDAIAGFKSDIRQRVPYGKSREAVEALQAKETAKMVEEVARQRAGTVRGYFYYNLANRMEHIRKSNLAKADGLEALATELDRLVEAHPV